MLDKFLFIIGGINPNGEILDSFSCLNLETFKWQHINKEGENISLAFHKAVEVFKFELKIDNPYFGFEYKKKTSPRPIK